MKKPIYHLKLLMCFIKKLLFNRNNVWANCNYHEPDQIYYDLEEFNVWRPLVNLNPLIFNDKFEPFYSLTNFAPMLTEKTVARMTDSLIKEVRVGLTAARSSLNLETKFKKKNEAINSYLGKYCEMQELLALNRISQ